MAKILEIEFKGSRKAFYANPQEFPLKIGDAAIVQAEKGEDLGRVINLGYLVDQRAGGKEHLQIIRKPSSKDIEQISENLKLENEAFKDCRKRIDIHGLNMKLVDVEYQFDRNKITFYFTSDKRVDFRGLVRDLAAKYRTRIELRQIGVRDEARRIGGLGVCGRQLCCSAFLREFEPVVTQFAKEQNLPLNPTKLSGVCGRLMCCLLYERDLYSEVRKQFPDEGAKIRLAKGTGILKSIDIFDESAIVQFQDQTEEKITLDDLKKVVEEAKKRPRIKFGKRKKNKGAGPQQQPEKKDSPK